jgi:hypothetical protein
MTADRFWLDVPYADKDAAKAAGARWDPAARRWYAPRPGVAGLERWAGLPPVPAVLPGEDRSFGAGLFVDLVPKSCWFTNVRSCVPDRDWERLRRTITVRAGDVCEVCGAGPDPAAGRFLEAHERWAYDDAARVQSLRRLICLCSPCHAATHYGLAQLRGRDGQAQSHLMAVTGMSAEQLAVHIGEAFDAWVARSRLVWELDLGILTGAGVTVTRPVPADLRAVASQVELRRTPPAR